MKKLIADTALRLVPLLYTPEQVKGAIASWIMMCVAAVAMGDTGAAILIIPGPDGYEVDPHYRPEPRENWMMN